ncbi:hypothetical protein KGF54_003487 [Candida jiufengensis]|uniref:uncharacterized protein n=1 Tax=Candida jiufengensis TaxID=497108 RepID=UPI002224BDA3|nr:uncharacterized protein KGF54_003487 [Candida jiufengensis]KAI5952620.1 hypothetical protein KGF54_003487 [Candida jiufengensis]
MIATTFKKPSEMIPITELDNDALEKLAAVSIPKDFNRLTAKGYIKELLRCFSINTTNYQQFKKKNCQVEKELDEIIIKFLNQTTAYFINYFETADYNLKDLILFNKNRDFIFIKNEFIKSIEFINSKCSSESGFELDLVKNHLFNIGNNMKKFIILNPELSNLYFQYKSFLQPSQEELELNQNGNDNNDTNDIHDYDNEINQKARFKSYEAKKKLKIFYNFIYEDFLLFEERLNKGELRKLNVYQLYKILGIDISIYKRIARE